MAKRLKTFTVYAKIKIDCGIDIKAESLEDAIDKARLLKETDFVEVFDNYIDGGLDIYGVYADG